LLAETRSHGGPTSHTKDTLPDWNGRYSTGLSLGMGRGRRAGGGGGGAAVPQEYAEPPQWIMGWATQMPTMLSLLTPEYQKRYVQQMYHKANTNAAQFSACSAGLKGCCAGGRARWVRTSWMWWSCRRGCSSSVEPTTRCVTCRSIARSISKDPGRIWRRRPSWLGETVGFWDGDTLITWTANVQGWFTHASWEYSNKMQLIEIWSPRRFADGRFAGIEHETVFYDPEALVSRSGRSGSSRAAAT
jgi:hypothetical protein